MPKPTNRKEIQRFLGLSGFYQTFIRNYADIAKPLTRLTSENINFEWNDECENAFNCLKQSLSEVPILAFPQPHKDFILEVDASGLAVGGILSQYQNNSKIHPVAYFSTALTTAQQKWSTYNLEACAMVCAVQHWYIYLTGTKFILNSDHNPLTYLQKKKEPRGKVARWIAELEVFDYGVRYIPGKRNAKADALSRNGKCKARNCQ